MADRSYTWHCAWCRYLFLEQHTGGDIIFEAVLEEKSETGAWTKLRFEDGHHQWKATDSLEAIEELPGRVPYAQPG